jgi:hypothetical protein
MGKAKFRVYRVSGGKPKHWEAAPLAQRLKQRKEAQKMAEPDNLTEMLARMWMRCDPNRGGVDPDELIPATLCSGGAGFGDIIETPNPLGGKPQWHWFIPRAEASRKFFAEHGFEIRSLSATG